MSWRTVPAFIVGVLATLAASLVVLCRGPARAGSALTGRIWPPGQSAIHGGQVHMVIGNPLLTTGLTRDESRGRLVAIACRARPPSQRLRLSSRHSSVRDNVFNHPERTRGIPARRGCSFELGQPVRLC